MTADRHLTPDDAAVAVRSFPRRFRAVFARPDDEDRWEPDEIGRRIGPEGRSAADHLLAADGVLALAARVCDQARRGDAVHPAVADLSTATWDDDHTPVPALLDQLEATAETTAATLDRVPTDDWGTPVRIADHDASPSLLGVVQDAVAAVAAHLRAAERVLAAVR